MQNYVKKLYSKFETKIINTLESDRFYQYFMETVDSGVRFYGQKNKKIIKKIDNTWVDALYDAIIPLEEIVIIRPRKFIEREEIIVPIELSRKSGADSVKHLSTHTHFISSVNEDGSVVPSKIMNIYNEESFNLYENRFVFYLIQKACGFIDLRYDILVGLKGDEFESSLKVDSSFSDNDESVEYNLSLKIHQGPDYLGSKGENEELLEKIEHIRLMFNYFKQSEFFQSLIGCRKVKSPISRTNLIMKNRFFKKCYDLWNFLEKYTDAGYSIEEYEIEGDFDQKYTEELNIMILLNYLIMKNNLDDIHNKMIDMSDKEPNIIKPVIDNSIVEEADPDYGFDLTVIDNIPEQGILSSEPDESGESGEFGELENSFEEPNTVINRILEQETAPHLADPADPASHANPASQAKREDIILAALVRALGDERILSTLEKALRAEKRRR